MILKQILFLLSVVLMAGCANMKPGIRFDDVRQAAAAATTGWGREWAAIARQHREEHDP